MASIVYQTNKKTGAIYAYKSVSYRDPDTKKPKSKRTYLGRYNPESGTIIPKAEPGKRNRSALDVPGDLAVPPVDIQEKLESQENELKALRDKMKELHARNEQLQTILTQICEVVTNIV